MKRFIRYLYEYDRGKRLRNVGFVKVEQGEDDCTLHIHGKGLHMKGERQLSLYLFYGEDGECIGIYQGTVDNVNPAINYRLYYTKEDTVVPDNFQKINGIILESEAGRKYAAVWNDSPVGMEHMRVLSSKEAGKEENSREEDPEALKEAGKREESSTEGEAAAPDRESGRREETFAREEAAAQGRESQAGEAALRGAESDRREENFAGREMTAPGREMTVPGRESEAGGADAEQREPDLQETDSNQRDEPYRGEEESGRQEDSVLRTDTLQGVNSTQNQEAADQRRETFERELEDSEDSRNPEDLRESKDPGEDMPGEDEPAVRTPGSSRESIEEPREDPCKEEDDRSLQARMQCRKIQRNDLARLPRCEWKWANNSFLLHGYYNYHHLALIDDGKRLRLGVPGIYHPQEAKAANTFGFTEFIPYQGMEMELTDNEKGNQEQFGYWCRTVKRPISM